MAFHGNSILQVILKHYKAIIDDAVNIATFVLRFCIAAEMIQTCNDFCRPRNTLLNSVQQNLHILFVAFQIIVEVFLQARQSSLDEIERIIDLVRNACCQYTQRSHFFRFYQLLMCIIKFIKGSLQFLALKDQLFVC